MNSRRAGGELTDDAVQLRRYHLRFGTDGGYGSSGAKWRPERPAWFANNICFRYRVRRSNKFFCFVTSCGMDTAGFWDAPGRIREPGSDCLPGAAPGFVFLDPEPESDRRTLDSAGPFRDGPPDGEMQLRTG